MREELNTILEIEPNPRRFSTTKDVRITRIHRCHRHKEVTFTKVKQKICRRVREGA